MAKQKNEAEQTTHKVEIVPIKVGTFEVHIVGTTPLIMHKFSDKARQSIEDKQAKKHKGAREARDPKAECVAACYVMPDSPASAGEPKCQYGVPSTWFKKAIVRTFEVGLADGLKGTQAKQTVFVEADMAGLIRLKCTPYVMREDAVRLPNKSLDLRYRPEFSEWSCKFRIRYNASVVSPEQIINVLSIAGFGGGVGDMRPEKCASGSSGLFEVKRS